MGTQLTHATYCSAFLALLNLKLNDNYFCKHKAPGNPRGLSIFHFHDLP